MPVPQVRFRHFWGVKKRRNLLASLAAKNFNAAYQAARLVADTFRNQITDPAAVTAHIQRHISRIITRTDIDAGLLNQYLLDMLIRHDDLEFELPDPREHESELALHSVEHEDEDAATPDHDPGIA